MNSRTKETNYYQISGAKEISAMASAEGEVQHLGYTATFPILLNIADEPTYFLSLKDAAGLVKKYAMVNIENITLSPLGIRWQSVKRFTATSWQTAASM